MNIEKILCDHRFVLGTSVLLALYISFMGKLQIPAEITNVMNSTLGRIIILVLIVYLNDKCQTVSLMLAIVFCLSLKSSNTENFYVEHKHKKSEDEEKSENDESLSEDTHDEEHEEEHEEEHNEEEYHGEEHNEEEYHGEEHHEEHHDEEGHSEEDKNSDDEISGIESFTNYSAF